MHRNTPIYVLSCILLLSLPALVQAETQGSHGRVTIESLLREMVDMERLATASQRGYESDQQSSYDRASIAPDRDGWFANGDSGQFIRQEQRDGRTEYVMAEMKGPGAIVRMWSPNPDAGGTIRIYIDGLDTPALEADFLALTSARMPEFPPPFSGRRATGANLYFPIPYQRVCKVSCDKPGQYYHVGYRTYPPGTRVEPFSMSALPHLKPVMAEVGAILEKPAALFSTRGDVRRAAEAVIPPGQQVLLHSLAGPAAIVRMELRLRVSTDRLTRTMRECLLTIGFDGEREPCVWAPLGDFFGSAPGLNYYQSLPLGMRENGMCYSNWYMPFAKSARIAVRNESQQPVRLQFTIWSKPAEWEKGRSLHFHAKWRNEWLPQDPPFLDWPMLQANGCGRFVGVMLSVFNPHGGWWGEGDEKAWVDDDKFPSFFGTGSEDYFGYGWGNTTLFTHAYHNQSLCTGPGNAGYTSVARYHILDDIPFRKSIRFFIEKWAGAEREYCCTAYWYAAPGSTDFFKPVPMDDRRVPPLPEPYRVNGAVEGEDLQIAALTGGRVEVQGLQGQFSGSRHLWWIDPKEGAILELNLPVAKAGRYKITLGLVKSGDYGIHQPLVNGKPAGQPLDLYAASVTPFRADLGEFDLQPGNLRIGLQCAGTNPNAQPKWHMAGIDYILLQPVQ